MGTWAVIEGCDEFSDYFEGNQTDKVDFILLSNKSSIPLLWFCLFDDADLTLFKVSHQIDEIYSTVVDPLENEHLKNGSDFDNKNDNVDHDSDIEYLWLLVAKRRLALQRLADKKLWLSTKYGIRIVKVIDKFLQVLSQATDKYIVLDTTQFALHYEKQAQFWDKYLQASLAEIFDKQPYQDRFTVTYQIQKRQSNSNNQSLWQKLIRIFKPHVQHKHEIQAKTRTQTYTFDPLWLIDASTDIQKLDDRQYLATMVGWDLAEQFLEQ